ncbi:MAG: thioredoxin family protein [Pirellulales bacterium]
MRRHWPRLVLFVFCAMLAAPAAAQHEGVRWQQDLEGAKTLARQTGRLVLIHFWTPSCGPCVTLDQNVFNQPGVAGAIEAQFVPVKLNANDNVAIAQGYGITRVPTDVIVAADGQLVGKLISPSTPAAYVAEVTQIASEHSSKLGSPFARTVQAPPNPPQINAAYANLTLAPNTQPAIAQPTAGANSTAVSANAATTSVNSAAAGPQSAERAPVAPLTTANQYTAPPAINFTQQPGLPPASPLASPPVGPLPGQVANPHVPSPPAISTWLPPSADASAQSVPAPQASATAAGPATVPDPKLLPPGAPPLGFDGYCPVSMRNQWKWVPGDPRWGIVHRGRTYWFASQTEQQQFWTDPDRFSPALSGMDPVMAIDHQQQVPGKREHSIDYDNLFYMFCSEATLQQFTANPERYSVGVRQAMGIPRGRLVR